MSNNEDKRAQEEELKKLEEQAYFELCQIIMEALQLQDIKILNNRLSSWKIKYKKLLDGSTALIEKIKRLQSDDYIGYIINMIMQRIKITEYIKIENQAKALRKLYLLIKENTDFRTLKSKVEEWKKTYPIQSFMKMYQRKVAYYTRTKTIEDNSFDQEKAFYDLIQITKMNGTPKDFERELGNWEDTYHIHDKFELDDFIKHQSDIKRYAQEIQAKANPDQENEERKTPEASQQFSDFAKQSVAVNSLLSIIGDSNNLNKVFEWVHKNSSIKFNDEYKALILSKTALEYSPRYLNRLKAPNINILNDSLSLDEYKEIDNIKRYAIISYFNLLLPKGQAIPNNYFDNYVEDIYYKSKNVKVSDKVIVPETTLENTVQPTEEAQLPPIDSVSSYSQDKKEDLKVETIVPNNLEDTELKLDVKNEGTTINLKPNTNSTQENSTPELEDDTDISQETTTSDLDISFEQPFDEYPDSFEIDLSKPTTEWHTILDTEESTYTEDTNDNSINLEENTDTVKEELPSHTAKYDPPESVTHSKVEIEEDSTIHDTLTHGLETKSSDDVNKDEEIDIIAYSPLFFDTIYNLSVQAKMISGIDNFAEQGIITTKSRNSIDREKNENI